MQKRWLIYVIVLVLGFVAFLDPRHLSGRSAQTVALQPALQSDVHRGAAQFAFGDWGGLTSDALRSSALPWKLAVAALALQEADGNLAELDQFDLARSFRAFGFNTPRSLGNWPTDLPAPRLEIPLGQSVGRAKGRILPATATLANTGCPACHSSVMYRADGSPDLTRAWLGMPNGAINLAALNRTLFTALRDYGDAAQILAAVEHLFPETDWRERATLRFLVLPQTQRRVAAQAAAEGTAANPGVTDRLGGAGMTLIPPGKVPGSGASPAIPDLGSRLWRTKFLHSGNYALPSQDHMRVMQASDITPDHRTGLAGIMAFFTVPSMGVTPEVALGAIADADAVAAWMQTYAPQPFPGEIAQELLPAGQAAYASYCADCHGHYDDNLVSPQLVRFPNWEGSVGTDPSRAQGMTQEAADAVNNGLFGQYVNARVITGYTAPPLTGLWASAPYLHNGSVPTLWHLMRPDQRPVWFQVGGHHLDMAKVGLAGQDDGAGGWIAPQPAWSIPTQVDTQADGFSNTGHATQFAPLSEAQKTALLEYLKLL